MEYYEVDVVFEEEVSTKSGIKMRKIRRKYLVNAQSVTASEALVYQFLSDSPYSYEVVSSKKSKIVKNTCNPFSFLVAQVLSDYVAGQIKSPQRLKDFFFKNNILRGITKLLRRVLKEPSLKHILGIKVTCSGR